MDRRTFLKGAGVVALAAGAKETFGADKYYPTKIDPALFENINRAKDPANKTPIEKSHAPVITAPQTVKVGEPFAVEVSVGEVVHSMGPAHWIEYIGLNIGNEPAGRADFQPKGYLKPKITFNIVIPKEAAPAGKVTLVAHQRCNLHGYWESSIDLSVS